MIEIEPLNGGLGVQLHGVTPSMVHDSSALDDFRRVFDEHHLVKCALPALDEDGQRKLASALGEITIRGSYDVDPARPDTQYVSNARVDGILGSGRLAFHHDHLFFASPLTAIMLYAIEVPRSGSITSYRSAADMYQILPPALRERVKSIECLHLYDYAKVNAGLYEPWADPATASADAIWDYKPLVWTHPATGAELLWLSPVEGFRGIEQAEGIALFEELEAFVQAHAHDVGHFDQDWKVGDLVVWNNVMVAHARRPFDRNEPRTLRRTPIIGALA